MPTSSASTAAAATSPVLVTAQRRGGRQLQPIWFFALVQVVQVDLLCAHVHQQLTAVRAEGEVRDRLARVLRVFAQVPGTEVRDALSRNKVHREGIDGRDIVTDAVRELKSRGGQTESVVSGGSVFGADRSAIYRVQDHHAAVVDTGVAVVTANRNQLGAAGIHGDALCLGILDVVVEADQAHFASLADVGFAHVELAAC